MKVIVSSKNREDCIVYHKSGCVYERRIHFKNKWSINADYVQGEKYRACKYCSGLKGDTRVLRKQIEALEKEKHIEVTFDELSESIYVKTNIGFWKLLKKRGSYKYLLFHRNIFNPSLNYDELRNGAFHRQGDLKETDSFMKVLNYIVSHEKAKVVMMNNYRNLPKKTKRQKKYYRQAERKERYKINKKMERIFAMIEEQHPELKSRVAY